MNRTYQLQNGTDVPDLSGHQPPAIRKKLLNWYSQHRRPLPWRLKWETHRDPYHVWVSEIMLQQTLIRVVIPVYERFLEAFPDPASLARADEAQIRTQVRGLGYYRRFSLLHKGVRQILEQSGSSSGSSASDRMNWPETFGGWKAISGVGDYTAAAIGSICFGLPKGAVDGNVERILCRLLDIRLPVGLARLKKHFQSMMDQMICQHSPGDFNQAMMELGQHICRPQQPLCAQCPLVSVCQANKNQSVSLAPAPKIRQTPGDVHLRLTIIRDGSRYALLKRPADARFLKATEGFRTEIYGADGVNPDGRLSCPRIPQPKQLLGTVRHHITHHRIKADVFLIKPGISAQADPRFHWYPREAIEEKLLSNLDRKAWTLYLDSDLSGIRAV